MSATDDDLWHRSCKPSWDPSCSALSTQALCHKTGALSQCVLRDCCKSLSANVITPCWTKCRWTGSHLSRWRVCIYATLCPRCRRQGLHSKSPLVAVCLITSSPMQVPQAQFPASDLSDAASSPGIAVRELSTPLLEDGKGGRVFPKPAFRDVSRNKTYPVSACIWECRDNNFNCRPTGLQAAADAFCRTSHYYKAYPSDKGGWTVSRTGATQGTYINKLFFLNGTFQTDAWSYCKNCGWIFTSVTCNGTRMTE